MFPILYIVVILFVVETGNKLLYNINYNYFIYIYVLYIQYIYYTNTGQSTNDCILIVYYNYFTLARHTTHHHAVHNVLKFLKIPNHG